MNVFKGQVAAPSKNKVAYLITNAFFICSGFTYAIWGVHIAVIDKKFSLNKAELTWLLFAMALGAILTMGPAGRTISKIGSARTCQIGGALLALSTMCIMITPHYLLLIAVLFIYGSTTSIFDTAMNAQAVTVEKALNKSCLSSMHGMFSLGGMLGAFAASIWIGQQLPSWLLFFITALITATVAILGSLNLLSDSTHNIELNAIKTSEKNYTLIALGFLSFLGLLVEGAMYDWTSIYMRDIVKSETSWIGSGYAGFCIGMILGRFNGDRVRTTFGNLPVLVASGIIASTGIVCVLVFPFTLIAIAGFSLAGLGGANFVPVLFSVASKNKSLPPSEAIALVARLGYFGFLLGPVLIGYIANYFGLPVAFLMVGFFALIIAVSAPKLMGDKNLY